MSGAHIQSSGRLRARSPAPDRRGWGLRVEAEEGGRRQLAGRGREGEADPSKAAREPRASPGPGRGCRRSGARGSRLPCPLLAGSSPSGRHFVILARLRVPGSEEPPGRLRRTLLRPPRFQMLGSSDLKPGGHNRLTQLPYPDSHLQDPNETGRTEAEGSWSELRIWETGIWGSHTGARMPRHPTCGEIRASPLHRPDLIGGTLPPASPVRLRVPRG